MPRPQLTSLALAALLVAGSAPVPGVDSHLDPANVKDRCRACHVGHGVSRSPMLGEGQAAVCLACHGSAGDADRAVRSGLLTPAATPQPIEKSLSAAYTHPIDPKALSRYDTDSVTCTSCHSPHRSPPSAERGGAGESPVKWSPRDRGQFEYELCLECHGSIGAGLSTSENVGRLVGSTSRSAHPLTRPPIERSPSATGAAAGRQINCTDCHGNDDPNGARGPHGSGVSHILRAQYTDGDGGAESATTYELCYTCHDREAVLDSETFPEHRRHVVERRASCSSCHNPHGSVNNRALIRFDEEVAPPGVSPSYTTGRLEYRSLAPGSGTCTLSCHGVEHAAAGYGSAVPPPDGPIGPGPIELQPIPPPTRPLRAPGREIR